MADITFPVPSCFVPDPGLEVLSPVKIECLDLEDLKPSDLKAGGRVAVVQVYPSTATVCSGQYGTFQVLNGLGGQIHRALFLGASATAFGTSGLVGAGGPEVDLPAVDVPVDCSDELTGSDKALAIRDRGRWYVVRLGAKLPEIDIPETRVVTLSVVGGNNDPYQGKQKTVTRDGQQVTSDEDCLYSRARHFIYAQRQDQFPDGPPQPQNWVVAGVDLAKPPEDWTPGSLFPTSGNKRLPDGLGFATLPAGQQQSGTLYGFPDWGSLFSLTYNANAPVAGSAFVRTGANPAFLDTKVWVLFDKPIQNAQNSKCHLSASGFTLMVTGATVVKGCVLEITFSPNAPVPKTTPIQVSLDSGAVTSSAAYSSLASSTASVSPSLQEPSVVDYGLFVGAAQDRDRLKRVSNKDAPPTVVAACWVRDDPSYLEIYFDAAIENITPSVAPGKFVVLAENPITVSGVALTGNKALLSLSGTLTSDTPVWVSIPPAFATKGAPELEMPDTVQVQAYVAEAASSLVPVYYADAIDDTEALRYGDQVEVDMSEAVKIEDLDETGTRTFYKIRSIKKTSLSVPVAVVGGNQPNVTPRLVGVADAVTYVAARPAPSDWSLLYLSDAPTTGDFVGTAQPPNGLGVAIVQGLNIWTQAAENNRDKCVWVANDTLLRAVFSADTGQVVNPRFIYDGQTPSNRMLIWTMI